MKILLIGLLTITSCLSESPVRFDGYQVYRVTPHNTKQLEILRQIEENSHGYNFWTDVTTVGKTVDVMVPPHLKYDFLDLLDLQGLEAELWIENVQDRINSEKRVAPRISQEYDWKEYQSLEQIYAWLDSLVAKYPGVVTPVVGGQTYEGRSIRGVKVSYGPGKKAVFLEGGIHAREWISPATVTYILNELLSSKDPTVRALAESRDWHVFPSINPDGYVYTNTNRMWRKTRKPYGLCYGADPNRNWGYNWMNGGSSNNPCSQTFAGSSAFSEVETRSLARYINSIASNIEVYLAFHSYSQLLLIPYGHAGLEKPTNNDEHHRIGRAAAESLASRYGTRYTVGTIPEAINYIASGGSMDWAMGTHRTIRLAYTYELRDKGRDGFVLPPSQIIPTGQETFDSVVRIFKELDKA